MLHKVLFILFSIFSMSCLSFISWLFFFFFFFVPYLIVSFLNDPLINSHRVFGFAFSLNVVVSVILFLMPS